METFKTILFPDWNNHFLKYFRILNSNGRNYSTVAILEARSVLKNPFKTAAGINNF